MAATNCSTQWGGRSRPSSRQAWARFSAVKARMRSPHRPDRADVEEGGLTDESVGGGPAAHRRMGEQVLGAPLLEVGAEQVVGLLAHELDDLVPQRLVDLPVVG